MTMDVQGTKDDLNVKHRPQHDAAAVTEDAG